VAPPAWLLLYFASWALAYVLWRIFRPSRVRVSLFYLEFVVRENLEPSVAGGRLYRLASLLSVLVMVASSAAATAWLLEATSSIILNWGRAPPTAVPPVPGVTLAADPAVLLSIAAALVVHEAAHAFFALREGMPVESVTLFLLFTIPGAYVKLDDERLNSLSLLSRVKIFSAGVSANAAAAGAALLLSVLIFPGFPFATSAAMVVSTVDGGPSDGLIPDFTAIRAVNGTRILSDRDLISVLSSAKPGDVVVLDTDAGELSIRLGVHPRDPDRGWMGVVLSGFGYFQPSVPLPNWAVYHISKLMILLLLFMLSAGLINALPAYPLDAGRALRDLLSSSLGERTSWKVSLALSVLIWGILILNLAYSLFRLLLS